MSSSDHNEIIIYTDGASKGNPGNGGWGALISTPDGKVVELGGYADGASNNQMELTAIIKALEILPTAAGSIVIITDSKYAIQGITSWVWGWQKNGWLTSSGQPVQNKGLWEALIKASAKQKNIKWLHTPGHAGIPGNERVDRIASDFAENIEVKLANGKSNYKFDVRKIPTSVELNKAKNNKSPNGTRKGKAWCYLSMIDGDINSHKTWADCEARIKGVSGARFKKALSKEEAESIRNQWLKM
ncbi:MAG: ribonuclease HI [Zetaproteobacteria bacterium]|nr:ribonuclease HI [Pseudobdellovibrionaceae bacterium]